MSSTKSLDALGDRLKAFEGLETNQLFIPNLPIYIRLDGRSFSKFTKGLVRPYDERMSALMIATTKYLVEQTHATIGYTQSDEISLVLKNTYGKGCIFNGKKQKIVSTLSAMASAFFNSKLKEYLPEKDGLLPTFDCRAFNVPSVDEATNCILWREQDATKNSILMAASHYFSFNEVQKKNTSVLKDMLLTQKSINWHEYPPFFKYGTYVQRETYMKDDTLRSRIVVPDWFESLKEFEHPGRIQIVMNDYPEADEE